MTIPTTKIPSSAVCVLSGGMDSATLLWYLKANNVEVSAISIDYGQRHCRELESAAQLCQRAGVFHVIVDLANLRSVMIGSSQTDPSVDVPQGHYEDESMKRTVVPNRNMVLLAIAGSFCASLSYEAVAYGAHAGDHAIYPDCRPEFVQAMQRPFALADYQSKYIYAPFIQMDKGDVARLGEELGVPWELTWTCYEGEEVHCGKCGACQERIEAFKKTMAGDSVEFAA